MANNYHNHYCGCEHCILYKYNNYDNFYTDGTASYGFPVSYYKHRYSKISIPPTPTTTVAAKEIKCEPCNTLIDNSQFFAHFSAVHKITVDNYVETVISNIAKLFGDNKWEVKINPAMGHDDRKGFQITILESNKEK